MLPDFSYEENLHSQGYKTIIGVDEVGRGPWAGPVVACAVVMDPTNLPVGATDSKKLTAKKREALYTEIMEKCQVAIGEASVAEIDTYNIREATFMAMKRAIKKLDADADYILVDGNALPKNLPCKAEAVIKGDGKVLSISCASIVAKVYRDNMMTDLHNTHPHYAWNSNAGYGTKAHQEGLAEVGLTEHHRRSFAPIKKIMLETGEL